MTQLELISCLSFVTATDYVSGGELFTHLYQRDSFTEDAVRIYAGELILALESLHKVRVKTISCTVELFVTL